MCELHRRLSGAPVGGSGRNALPIESGPNEGVKVPTEDIAKALDLYYEMCGWDKETGAPTAGKLHELGIGWVAELLYES